MPKTIPTAGEAMPARKPLPTFHGSQTSVLEVWP